MKIILTGGSSFTGTWFIRELAAAGHEVTAIFRKSPDEYAENLRRQRVLLATKVCRPIFGCSFGDDRFLALIGEGGWDLLAHHAADVTNYKSPDFDAIAAVANNTHKLPRVLEALKSADCRRLLLSGSVFEGGEGAGSQGLPDFSPYGLSKALTARTGVPLLLCPSRRRARQVRHPQPVRPVRGTEVYRISHQELARRCHAELLQPDLRPGQYSRLAAGQGLRPIRTRGAGRKALPGPIPAATPRARVLSHFGWRRKCGPG